MKKIFSFLAAILIGLAAYAQDPAYKPYDLKATNVGRDTVLFEWKADATPYYFSISMYDENENYIPMDMSYLDGDQRSVTVPTKLTKPTKVGHWNIYTEGDEGYAYVQGDGFTIAGDGRIPSNLRISADGDKKYTIRWDASDEVHHSSLTIYGGDDPQYYDELTVREKQVTLADNGYYDISVQTFDAESNPIGMAGLAVNTYTQDPRDLNLYFYIPEARGFVGENGAAVRWGDAIFGGENYQALAAVGDEAPHWYKAVLAGFNRPAIKFELVNATSADKVTKVAAYAYDFGEWQTEGYWALGENDDETLYLQQQSEYNPWYPHDYAATDMTISQDANYVVFTCQTVEENVNYYYVKAWDDKGNEIIYGTMSKNEGLFRYEQRLDNNKEMVIAKWSVYPSANWNEIYAMTTYDRKPFKLAPSPYVATELKATDNGDGTYTFSWTPAAAEEVKQYGLVVYDAGGNTVVDHYNIKEASYTDKATFMFSGRCAMKVYSYDEYGWNNLGTATDSFMVAPVAAHDIAIRILINPASGYDTSEGVKFEIIKTANGSWEPVDATDDGYGWWKYVLNTTERGARIRLSGVWGSQIKAYGDMCVAYTGSYKIEDCEAHADDYLPQNLLAEENEDGSWSFSWSMNYTENVRNYRVEVSKGGSYVWGTETKTLQCKAPAFDKAGDYVFSVRAYDENWGTLGFAEQGFTVKAKEERDIVLRVLVQPGASETWGAYTFNADDNDYTTPVLFTEDGEGWFKATFTTTAPAVKVRFKKNFYYYDSRDFSLTESTCIEYDQDFKEVDCETAKLHNYKVSNVKAEDLQYGKYKFTWDCAENPSRFHVRVHLADSSTIYWSQTVGGQDRSVETKFTNDSTMELVWYVVPVVGDDYNEQYLWDLRAYGMNFTCEASKYIAQNIQAKQNADLTWTFTWDALPAPAYSYNAYYLRPGSSYQYGLYPNDNTTTRTSDRLTKVGTYTLFVETFSENGESIGLGKLNFEVKEVAAREFNVRLLLHPDAETAIQNMRYQKNSSSQDVAIPTEEGEGWYKYTFTSTMPAPEGQLMGYAPTFYGDTCLQYTQNRLWGADCNEKALDCRIKAGSMKAVSEAGRVALSWSPVNKSEMYEVAIERYHSEYGGYWENLQWAQTKDTFYTYIVPDQYDGEEVRWSVTPYMPHNLNSVIADEKVTLHKSEIILSELKALSTDSVHFRLSWKSNTENIQYQIQIFMGGNKLVDKVVTAKQFDFEALTGYNPYNWQIRALNSKGEPLTTWQYDKAFEAKSSLRVLTNLQGNLSGKTLNFSWNTSAPRTVITLWRMINAWSSEPMFGGDSVVTTNNFSFQAEKDGRYYFSTCAEFDGADGAYSICEGQTVALNLFTEGTLYDVKVSTTKGGYMDMDPSGKYPASYELRLNPYSTGDYRFVAWSDGYASEYRTIKITSDTTLIALYEEMKEHHVVVKASEGGYLRYAYYGEDTPYEIDSISKYTIYANVQAVANEGYTFYAWSDGVDASETYRYMTLTTDTTVIAIFKPNCTVKVAAGEGGRVQVTCDNPIASDKANKTYTVKYGTEISVKANPNDGYRFKKWSDGDFNVSRKIVVTESLNLSAEFEKADTPLKKYTVRVLSSNTELGEVNSISGTYNEGDKITLIATPNEGVDFIQWSDGVKDATRILTVSQDTTLTAQFDYKKITVAISASEGGKVNDEVNGTYNYGEIIKIVATPNEGYKFIQWSDGAKEAEREITLKESLELKAQFTKQLFLITFLNADGAFIEATEWAYGETPACTVTPTLEPTEEWIYTFKGWDPEIKAATANAIYTAVYDQKPNPAQGVEETIVGEKAQKVIINGQFFILRGERVYTIQGQLVK